MNLKKHLADLVDEYGYKKLAEVLADVVEEEAAAMDRIIRPIVGDKQTDEVRRIHRLNASKLRDIKHAS